MRPVEADYPRIRNRRKRSGRSAGALRATCEPQRVSLLRHRAARGGLAAANGTCFNFAMEERARRIVATAVELAEQGGFEAVRLRDVASRAGVALGTLYRRFRSKEDLLVAALEMEVEEVEARFASRPPQGGDARERVALFFQATTRAMLRRPNLTRAMLRAVASGEPELAQKVAAFHGRVGLLIGRALCGPGGGAGPSEEEQRIAHVLGQVWFASLVGWAGGLHGQGAVVDQTRRAAELMLAPGR
jgi:AcrR family transcriptional regulator